MPAKIEKKITAYKVKTEALESSNIPEDSSIEKMNELVERPEILQGTTYKIKTPNTEAAVYVTINDIILNAGTEHEEKRPYEIFLTSKDTSHHQWMAALTRVISAVFRKGGDVSFLAEELKLIFDPKGGYIKKGQFIPSLIADIGYVLEKHLQNLQAK